ncbi:unnamed protein product [Agarophyton chilense]|eukprot:gb/GEZJ01003622.1/.p1 GENE.gb/GEZJ01003622.1/~~gb/GEZJ01003622.1/.p1  ORF type:complete len:550 (+),score=70.06 gb/GEZJ01003622.1/:301-1950(+)
MRVPAGDERTGLLLRKRYQAVGCYYCRDKNASHATDHVHTDCPYRPCFLCKKKGHISFQCPYRTKPNAHSLALSRLLRSRERLAHLHCFVRERETSSSLDRLNAALPYLRNRQFDCQVASIVLRAHPKRITAVEWHPSGSFLLSGDKAGVLRLLAPTHSLASASFHRKTVPLFQSQPSHVHHCNINNIAFDSNPDVCYTSSSDGKVSALRIPLMETGRTEALEDPVSACDTIVDLNPDGWRRSVSFKMAYGMAYDTTRKCLYVGASDGTIRRFDPRESCNTADVMSKFHASKVTCIHLNPVNSDLLVTASNDTLICLWDARKFVENQSLGWYKHDRVVSSAYFSPNTGSKLLTTSLDNKLRVWDNIHAIQGFANQNEDAQPLEIVHSHDFHRHLTAFRAVWDPKDWRDDLFMCGRFLGDAYLDEEGSDDDAQVLHPIDMFSAKAGTVVHSLIDSDVQLICTSNKYSPSSDVIATAASQNLILWSPPPKDSSDDGEQDKNNKFKRRARRNSDASDNDESDGGGGAPGPRKKLKTVVVRSTKRSMRTRSNA